MQYKGDPLVLVGIFSDRTEWGAWSSIYEYEGTQTSCVALANSVPLGPQVNYENRGAVCRVRIVYGILTPGTEQVFERWEVDTEFVDKDIMYSKPGLGLSDDQREQIKLWRANPQPIVDGNPDNWTTPMLNIASMILRGVESLQQSTIVLKRSRTMSASNEPRIVLHQTPPFYSTGALIQLEAVPPVIAATLPVDGGDMPSPADAKWGWLPRLANRSYIGRGMVEEQNDFIFAAWSTFLYNFAG